MNIEMLLDTVAAMHPDRVALTSAGRRITYAQLQQGAQARGAGISAKLGGRPLGYVGTNQAAFPLSLFTAACAGVPFVPMNFRVKQAEFEYFLALAAPAMVVAEERYHEILRNAVRESGVDTEVGALRDLFSGTAVGPASESTDAVLLFTSGTSSAPKLVYLTHDNLCSYVIETVEAGSAGAEEAALLAAPPYHVAAVANTLTSLYRGRRLVLMERFDAREWLELVATESVTHAMVVPTMLVRILEELEREPALAPVSLRTLSYGGSLPPEGLVERALAVLPESVGLVNAFGLTETSSTVAMLTPEDHRDAWHATDPDVRARLRSVGRPVPGIEIQVQGPDGRQAAPGEPGEVCIRGRQVSRGYADGRSRVDADGWLPTGDTGRVDTQGYVFVDGRLDDLIIRGGENINPHEIEAVLAGHPSVTEALAVGVPHPEWGETVAALVTGTETVDERVLQDWVRGQLAGYKVPVRIVWVPELPRNDMGKPVRSLAEALVTAESS